MSTLLSLFLINNSFCAEAFKATKRWACPAKRTPLQALYNRDDEDGMNILLNIPPGFGKSNAQSLSRGGRFLL